MKPDDSQKQFLLQEYSQIREEIMWNIKQITETERYAIAISGLVWAWLVTQQWNLALIIAAAIPALATKLLHYKRKGLSTIWSRQNTFINRRYFPTQQSRRSLAGNI
jgi:hypothetical protein